MKILLAVFLLLQSAQPVPKYRDFPAAPFTGKPAAPTITADLADFRQQLQAEAAEMPNFAGYYRIVKFSCGSECVLFAIVDAKTGEVFVGDFSVAFGANLTQEALRRDEPLQFKPDSRLLVVVGSRNEKGEGCYFYEWTGDKLRLIKAILEKQ